MCSNLYVYIHTHTSVLLCWAINRLSFKRVLPLVLLFVFLLNNNSSPSMPPNYESCKSQNIRFPYKKNNYQLERISKK